MPTSHTGQERHGPSGFPVSPGADPHQLAADPQIHGIGHIEGLHPRLNGQAGDVPAADVDLLDDLDGTRVQALRDWLRDKPSLPLRRTRLRVLASFLRWLNSSGPAACHGDLLTAEPQVDAYCLAALVAGLPPRGTPLAKATVMRRRAILHSFYTFTRGRGAAPANAPGCTADRLTPAQRRLVRAGAARLAEQGRLSEAVAVALLEATGTSAAALSELTDRDIHLPSGIELALVTVVDDRDDIVAFPLPAHLRAWVAKLCTGRPAGQPLLTQEDGTRVNLEWMRNALADAALAAGSPPQLVPRLDPQMLRARAGRDLR
ncbi:hypothetical protein AB0J71_46495 [Nonomuraea sp. NPDC049637]|uniref:hypothetical protein n=1 Tax=Nonomuraea sp. NPDC049637 TaxID=3154356 RepID=UPI0034177571